MEVGIVICSRNVNLRSTWIKQVVSFNYYLCINRATVASAPKQTEDGLRHAPKHVIEKLFRFFFSNFYLVQTPVVFINKKKLCYLLVKAELVGKI